MAYGSFKDLSRKTAADKILRDKALNTPKNTKYDAYQGRIASMVYECFDKKTSGETVKKLNLSNKEFSEELPKAIIKKFKNRKVHSFFIDNTWDSGLANTQLISTFNEGTRFLLCAIDIFSKYAWVIPVKDKKGSTIINAFQNNLDESNYKPNKIWADKGSEFCNTLMKSWLEKMT